MNSTWSLQKTQNLRFGLRAYSLMSLPTSFRHPWSPGSGYVLAGGREGSARSARVMRCRALERYVLARRRVRRRLGIRGRLGPARTTVARTAEQLDVVGDDLELRALLAGRRLPLVPAKLALDAHGLALAQEPRDRLGSRSEHRDVHEVDAVLPLARRRVLPTVVDGHAHLEDGHAALRAVEFGVAGKVARDDDPVDAHFDHTSSRSSLKRVYPAPSARPDRHDGRS